MKNPVRTPEGEPRRCPFCHAVTALEPSPVQRDATCPRCGALLLPADALDPRAAATDSTLTSWAARDAFRKLVAQAGDRLHSSVSRRAEAPPASPERDERTHARLDECLRQLAPRHREVIVLRTFDELEWHDIDQRLGLRPGEARQLYSRAKSQLVMLLRQRDEGTAGG
jgi:RNA polymerase sigma factor (sigma-70 family)